MSDIVQLPTLAERSWSDANCRQDLLSEGVAPPVIEAILPKLRERWAAIVDIPGGHISVAPEHLEAVRAALIQVKDLHEPVIAALWETVTYLEAELWMAKNGGRA